MRSFPVDVLPSHVHLSADHQRALFGDAAMTIECRHTQPGQVVYRETLAVFGAGNAFVRLRVLGPNWKETSVELTHTEAGFLGVQAQEAKEGDVSQAGFIRLVGPAGEVQLDHGCLVPTPSLLMSVNDARRLYVTNGDRVSVRVQDVHTPLEHVLVRVHPEFLLRLQVHQDLARDLWIVGSREGHIMK